MCVAPPQVTFMSIHATTSRPKVTLRTLIPGYPQVTFMNIENIHAMRASLRSFLGVLGKQVPRRGLGTGTPVTPLRYPLPA